MNSCCYSQKADWIIPVWKTDNMTLDRTQKSFKNPLHLQKGIEHLLWAPVS